MDCGILNILTLTFVVNEYFGNKKRFCYSGILFEKLNSVIWCTCALMNGYICENVFVNMSACVCAWIRKKVCVANEIRMPQASSTGTNELRMFENRGLRVGHVSCFVEDVGWRIKENRWLHSHLRCSKWPFSFSLSRDSNQFIMNARRYTPAVETFSWAVGTLYGAPRGVGARRNKWSCFCKLTSPHSRPAKPSSSPPKSSTLHLPPKLVSFPNSLSLTLLSLSVRLKDP